MAYAVATNEQNRSMIRSSNHPIKFANQGKRDAYHEFVAEYRRCAVVFLGFLWNNQIQYFKNVRKEHFGPPQPMYFDIEAAQLDIPAQLAKDSFRGLTMNTPLSARALKCCATQVIGCIRAVTEKQRKRIWQLSRTPTLALANAIENNKPTMPDLTKLNPEINSICAEWVGLDSHFSGLLQLKSLGISKAFALPLNFHRHSKKFKTWEMKNSFLLRDDSIDIRWERKAPPIKNTGNIAGADQGVREIYTQSDGQTTGNSLTKILSELARKVRGSDAFRRKCIERDNLIRESLNKIDFSNINEVRFEQVKHLRKGKRTSASLRHWTYALIEKKMRDLAELEGFQFTLSSSPYRSQRCSSCGLVRKQNRKGERFSCSACGHEMDADLNAARNHACGLPPLPFNFREKNQISDFWWTENGIFDLDGVELQAHFPEISR